MDRCFPVLQTTPRLVLHVHGVNSIVPFVFDVPGAPFLVQGLEDIVNLMRILMALQWSKSFQSVKKFNMMQYEQATYSNSDMILNNTLTNIDCKGNV